MRVNREEVLARILGLWEEYAPRYKDSFGGVSMFREFAKKMEASLLPNSGGTVLDGGCGPGLQFERIIRKVQPQLLVGVDYSPEMLSRAGKVAERLNGRYDCEARVEYADLLEGLPFPDNHFDVQVFHLVHYYLPFRGWGGLIRESFRVAKPGGYMVMTNFLKKFDFRKEIGSWVLFKEMILHPWAILWTILKAKPILCQFQELYDQGILDYPSEEELVTLCEEVGFEGVEVTEILWKGTGNVIRAFKPDNRLGVV